MTRKVKDKLVTERQLELALKPIRKDIENLAISFEKAFQKVLTKEDAKQFLTKEDAKQFLTKEDAKKFATKEDLKQFASKKDLNNMKQDILDGVKAMMEVRDDELDGKHQAELDMVVGKGNASQPWRSVPRRLTLVEQDLEHVKDDVRQLQRDV